MFWRENNAGKIVIEKNRKIEIIEKKQKIEKIEKNIGWQHFYRP